MSFTIGKKGWAGKGGGTGTITNGQNLGSGSEVFAGISGGNTFDFRSLTGADGIVLTQSANEIEISGKGIVGGTIPALQSFVEGTGDNPNATLINNAFFAAVVPWGDGQVNAIQIWIEVLGGTPTAFDAAIYDEDGTLLVSKATPVAPSSVGTHYITLDSTIDVLKNKKYWVGIAGSVGSNTQLNGDNSSTNSTSWNRIVAGTPTIPAGNLPAGTITAIRYWFRLVKL